MISKLLSIILLVFSLLTLFLTFTTKLELPLLLGLLGLSGVLFLLSIVLFRHGFKATLRAIYKGQPESYK